MSVTISPLFSSFVIIPPFFLYNYMLSPNQTTMITSALIYRIDRDKKLFLCSIVDIVINMKMMAKVSVALPHFEMTCFTSKSNFNLYHHFKLRCLASFETGILKFYLLICCLNDLEFFFVSLTFVR